MPIVSTGKKNKNGLTQYKVIVNYTDSNGQKRNRSKRVYGKDVAYQTEYELKQEVNGGQTESEKTVAWLYDEYLAAKVHEVRETTLAKSKSNLQNHVLPYVSGVKLGKLNAKTLQKWKNDINALDLKVRTKNNAYKVFNAMLNFAVKMEYIQSNPLSKLGGFIDALEEAPQDKLHYYTADEFKRYIACALPKTECFRDWALYVFFNIAFFTGMRKGEINALKWSDIDGNILHVRRSVSLKVKGKQFVETPPKTKSSRRDIQIPVPLLRILDEHKERQKAFEEFSEDFRVCGGIRFLPDTTIANYNKKCAAEANLFHIRVHDFRHTHATLLINEGINIQEIARRLGHSNTNITWKTYAHLYPREEERALRVLNQF